MNIRSPELPSISHPILTGQISQTPPTAPKAHLFPTRDNAFPIAQKFRAESWAHPGRFSPPRQPMTAKSITVDAELTGLRIVIIRSTFGKSRHRGQISFRDQFPNISRQPPFAGLKHPDRVVHLRNRCRHLRLLFGPNVCSDIISRRIDSLGSAFLHRFTGSYSKNEGQDPDHSFHNQDDTVQKRQFNAKTFPPQPLSGAFPHTLFLKYQNTRKKKLHPRRSLLHDCPHNETPHHCFPSRTPDLLVSLCQD